MVIHAMKRPAPALALLPLAVALAGPLAGCESSSRFDGMFSSQPQPIAARPAPLPEPGIPAPTAPVTSQPLPPVGGADPNMAAPLPGQPGAVASGVAPPGTETAPGPGAAPLDGATAPGPV